jgi:hypothetical protein
MRARYARTLACGHYANVGDPVVRVGDKQFVCVSCAVSVSREQYRDAERLLDDPKIRALLVRALTTDSDAEAGTALALARKLHRKVLAS